MSHVKQRETAETPPYPPSISGGGSGFKAEPRKTPHDFAEALFKVLDIAYELGVIERWGIDHETQLSYTKELNTFVAELISAGSTFDPRCQDVDVVFEAAHAAVSESLQCSHKAVLGLEAENG